MQPWQLKHSVSQSYNSLDIIYYTPDVYAASAADSHRLTAVTQVDSKRLHSLRLSLTCQKKKCLTEKQFYNDLFACKSDVPVIVLPPIT